MEMIEFLKLQNSINLPSADFYHFNDSPQENPLLQLTKYYHFHIQNEIM